ncbi:MAG: 16S rRNA (cytosine(1402)-N(4))-methyltransferase RsmH [Pseudomonadota bacterium]|nr:16S rRNA (cytosine(1402)-N(4))-methyltransferase RsmH [Pseudomonadota bacterium]
MTDGEHIPVLLEATVAALAVRPDAIIVDGTFGRGGHTRALLDALGHDGRVIGIDRDPAAETAARHIDDGRFTFRRAWFSEMSNVLRDLGIEHVDGVLLDLGISSPQINDPERGFSFRADGPLDMRMDPTRGESAAEFIARATARELTEVLRDYGEERFAPSIARAIVARRGQAPILRTRELATVVGEAVGPRTRRDWSQDPATRTFQAIRIYVNRELAEITLTLPRALAVLRTGGRLAVISFHSLEDRIVKRFMAAASQPFGGEPALARFPLRADQLPGAPLALVGRAQQPQAEEVARNPRARSAVLRVAERTAHDIPPALRSEESVA